MKSILITNHQGGVGKSAIASQFAHYLADKLQLRVLFIDLDSQRNSTKALTTKQAATLSATNAAEAFTNPDATVEACRFVVMPGSDELDLLDMEKSVATSWPATSNPSLPESGNSSMFASSTPRPRMTFA
jgi:cellulose biosynthesis protein BcsQ